jgi:hypothetical protein
VPQGQGGWRSYPLSDEAGDGINGELFAVLDRTEVGDMYLLKLHSTLPPKLCLVK